MKVIVSHDVDHITVWEHKYDLIVPKFVARSFIEFILGYVSISEIGNRFKDIIRNKWQSLEEIAQFDKENEVNSTFFLGVNNGIGLSYSLDNAKCWTKMLLDKGFDVGVHGISFENYDDIKNEYDTFKSLSGLQDIGIRVHYLRNSPNLVATLNQAGYMFDSTLYEFENPFKVRNLWEFPLHIMDGHLFYENSRWQNQSLEAVKDKTKRIIEQADKKGIKYLTVLFHDRYFSNGFKSWKNWYVWCVNYFRNSAFEFISYRDAIQELEKEI